jgi:serine/threonine protein kinase
MGGREDGGRERGQERKEREEGDGVREWYKGREMKGMEGEESLHQSLVLPHAGGGPGCCAGVHNCPTIAFTLHAFICLCSGRFSKVKQAKCKTTNAIHALKMLQDSTSEEQFYRELCIGSRLKHRNLVQYNLGLQHSHTMVISMEL